jgi:hypothetical protein
MEKEVSLDAGVYGREESNVPYRFPQIVHERRPQRVVQEDLEDLWGSHTSSVES